MPYTIGVRRMSVAEIHPNNMLFKFAAIRLDNGEKIKGE